MNDAHWLLIIRDRKCFRWNRVPSVSMSQSPGFFRSILGAGLIYTNVAHVLLAVNPHRSLEHLYGTGVMQHLASTLKTCKLTYSPHTWIHTYRDRMLWFIAQAAFFSSGPASIQPSWAGFEEVASWTAGGLVFRVPKWSLLGVPIQAGYRPQVPNFWFRVLFQSRCFD